MSAKEVQNLTFFKIKKKKVACTKGRLDPMLKYSEVELIFAWGYVPWIIYISFLYKMAHKLKGTRFMKHVFFFFQTFLRTRYELKDVDANTVEIKMAEEDV